MNTWGLSSSVWLAENIYPQLKSLTKIDFSDTLKRMPRSDLCQSVNSMLNACQTFSIESIDLSENFLDYDGARAFKEFLSSCSHLQILKLDSCKLGPKSCEMILEAVMQNPNLKLKQFSAPRNEFEEEGFQLLGEAFASMQSLQYVNFSTCVNDEKKNNGLHFMIQALL